MIQTALTLTPRPVLEFVHAATCHPDYWGGHHLPYIQIHAFKGMTLKQIKDALRYELRDGYIGGNCDAARLLSADLVRPHEEKLADALTRAAYAAVNRIKPAKKGQRTFFNDLDDPCDDDDDDNYVCAYFVLRDLHQ